MKITMSKNASPRQLLVAALINTLILVPVAAVLILAAKVWVVVLILRALGVIP